MAHGAGLNPLFSPRDRHVFVRPEFHVTDHQGLILDERMVNGNVELRVLYVSEADGCAFSEWLSPARVRAVYPL